MISKKCSWICTDPFRISQQNMYHLWWKEILIFTTKSILEGNIIDKYGKITSELSKTFINTYVPIFMHRIERETLRDNEKSFSPFTHVLNWPGLKSFRAVSRDLRQLPHTCNQSLHLGDLLSPAKSLEGKQSAVLASYAGAQNTDVGQIWRSIHILNPPLIKF